MNDKVTWDMAFPSDYFGHQHMPEDGSDIIVEIKNVNMEMVKNQHGGDTRCIAHITADPEKWIVNKTNAKTINKVHGTTHPWEWVGKKIQLYVKPDCQSPQGSVPGIRVRDFEPK